MSSYFKLGALFKGISTTPTAGGTTTLTASSRQLQQFTGTSTQTVVLPDATTLPQARRFDIMNRSTGAITVNANGGSLVATVPAGSQRYFFLTDNSVAAGTWRTGGVTGSGGATVSTSDKLNLLSGMAGAYMSTDNIESRPLNYRQEEVGGQFWITRTSVPVISNYAGSGVLNGFIYLAGGNNNSNVIQTTVTRFDDTVNYWTARQALGTAHQGPGVALAGSGLLRFGGATSVSSVATSELYNDITNTWLSKASMSVARYSGGGDTLFSGLVMACGGTTASSNTSEVYNSTADAWYSRAGFSYSGTTTGQRGNTYNKNFYVMGGFNGTNFVTSVSQYLEDKNVWFTPAALPQERQGMRGCAANGFNYLPGGTNNSTFIATVYQYSDTTNAYLTYPSISSAKLTWNHSSVNGNNFVLGGGTYSPSTDDSSSQQFVSSSFVSVGLLKRTSAAPTSILVGVLASALQSNPTVQIRSDGDAWKYLTAGVDSALKTGETLTGKFNEAAMMYVTGGSLNSGGSSTTATNENYNDIQDNWVTKAAQGVARTQQYGFPLGGKGYVAGGSSDNTAGNASTAMNYFDDLTNAWTASTVLLSARFKGAGARLNGYGYAIGGRNGAGTTIATVDKYDSAASTWTNKASLNAARDNTECSMIVAGQILVGGGTNGGAVSSSELYNDVLNTWTTKANLVSALWDISAATQDGYGYIIGGNNGSNVQSTTQKYDAQANTWSSVASLNTARGAPVSNFANGYIYCATGATNGTFTTYGNGVERYNANANTWTNRSGTMTVARFAAPSGYTPGPYRVYEARVAVPALYAGLGSVSWITLPSVPAGFSIGPNGGYVNGVYRYAGGYGSSSIQSVGYYYDPVARAWVSASSMPSSQSGSAFVLKNFLYAVDQQSVSSALVQRFNDSLGTWAATTSTNNARIRITPNGACALNGFGYVLGGGTASTSTSEQWNDSTLAWTNKAARTNTSTSYATNNSIDGFYYSVGGSDNGSAFVSTVEQYNDAANTFTAKGAYPVSLASMSSLIFGGFLYSANGYNGSYTNATYRYNTSFDSWIAQQNSTQARAFGTGIYDMNIAGQNGGDTTTVDQLTSSLKNAILGMALEIK